MFQKNRGTLDLGFDAWDASKNARVYERSRSEDVVVDMGLVHGRFYY